MRTKGPYQSLADQSHLESIAASGKGRRGGRGEWGAKAVPLSAPPARWVPSPGTHPSPAGSLSPSRGRPGDADAKASPARAGTRASLAR